MYNVLGNHRCIATRNTTAINMYEIYGVLTLSD